ncbi:MAG: DNA alkylation repair protein [Dehalococcoidia bacterium]|nr:DNA alkylation repair protein [Dehalococcoidia bacterium]
MDEVLELARRELRENADETKKLSGQKFFKESVRLYGLPVPAVNRIARDHFKLIRQRSKHEIFALCEDLWQSGYMEEALIACTWSHSVHKSYQSEDMDIFENWLDKYVSNWATCDTLCNHSVSDLVDMYPALVDVLKKWARSENRWVRRGAAVSLIVPAKRGRFLEDVFLIADTLLLDSDDLVQKGYGWMLKEAAENHQHEVFNYVMRNKSVMPRTSLRYAIEKMPGELKARAMEK